MTIWAMRMSEDVLEIGVTAFKAKCLALFKELEARRLTKVVVTRRGKPIAELAPAPLTEVPDIYGCMEGMATIPPDVDLTKPVLEEIPDAERGILHR